MARSGALEHYLNQIPLLLIVIIPLVSAIIGIKSIRMKSVIHFQQGAWRSSPWRVASTMTLITIPTFFIWCLCLRNPSSLFFQIGATMALVLTTFTSSSILHYLPSPSVLKYYQLRYQSENLAAVITVIQTVVLASTTILLLYVTSTFLSSVLNISVYITIPLVAYFSLFSIIFSGHSSMMNASFLIYLLLEFIGITLYLYKSIENVHTIKSIVNPEQFRLTDIITSILVGFIVNFHLLNSSFLYQVYSPIPTMYKLHLSLILYGVFQLFASLFVYVSTTLFINFLQDHCNLNISFATFLQFVKVNTTLKFEIFLIVASIISLLVFCIQWLLISLGSILWEEYIARKLRLWNPIQQLCSLQFTLLLFTTALIVITIILHLTKLEVIVQLPTIIYSAFSIFALFAGFTICGYYIPLCSSKGAICGLILTLLVTILSMGIYLINNPSEKFVSSCYSYDPFNTTVSTRSISMDRVVYFVSHLPPQSQPITTFLLFIIICTFASFITGGQDQMSLDWNLIAFTWATSVRTNVNVSKRAFVDSESFRYAQQSNNNYLNNNSNNINESPIPTIKYYN